MVRVGSEDVLVVPPFECAWLSNKDARLKHGGGCLTFEAKGENDVTLLFHSHAGSKRIQPTRSQTRRAALLASPSSSSPSSSSSSSRRSSTSSTSSTSSCLGSYAVILGSHCNSKLVIEKDGQKVHEMLGVRTSSSAFAAYWIDFNRGRIAIGRGSIPGHACFLMWRDDHAHEGIERMGLSAWDKHVCYKNIATHPPVQGHIPVDDTKARGIDRGTSSEVCPSQKVIPSLASICCRTLVDNLKKIKGSSSGSSSGMGCSDGWQVECIRTLLVAEFLRPNTEALFAEALDFLVKHFEEVFTGPTKRPRELYVAALPRHCLARMLAHDRLNVTSEKFVYDIVLTWARAQKMNPLDPDPLDALLGLVRFPLMAEADLEAIQKSPFFASTESKALSALIEEAERCREAEPSNPALCGMRIQSIQSGKERMVELLEDVAASKEEKDSARRSTPRVHPRAKELVHVSDGDCNGVCYYLGSDGGRELFVNPCLTQRVRVRASGPSSRFTDPRVIITSRASIPTSYTEPVWDTSTHRWIAWLELDLVRTRLWCTRYSIRHDGSGDFLRNWELRGSSDGGSTWMTLDVHRDDGTIQRPLQCASWPVPVHVHPRDGSGCNVFRIVLTGPNAAKTHRLCMCGLELYGILCQ